ncbi:transcriptional regulator [Pelistega suis]|uniref:Transcriptional regulator n=2 Tax=Pelistega suis TaxID=1631957 RepID=A0A849P7Q7_9BURK|nr:transcriptional regulator [Pelistega suis]
MKLLDYVKANRGRAAEIASIIKVRPEFISMWALGRRQVPAERCPDIEQATGRAVTCEEMRPDINWAILRQSPKKAR